MARSVGKGSGKKGINYHKCQRGADDPCAQAQNICVVMLPCGHGGKAVPAEGGANTTQLVCGDGHADAGAAYKYGKIALTGLYCGTGRMQLISS